MNERETMNGTETTSTAERVSGRVDPLVRRLPHRPTAWACRKCGKFDWADTDEQLAQPEHVSYRGIDLGTCGGQMVPLYSEEDIARANP